MRTNRLFATAGLVSFLVFLLLQIPAGITGPLLAARGVRANGLTGTIWHGEVRSVEFNGLQLQQARWETRPSRLLLGRLEAGLDAKLPDGFLKSTIAWSPTGLRFSELQAATPLAPIAPSLAGLAGKSQLALQMRELLLRGGWVGRAIGTARFADVSLPIPGISASAQGGGTYEVTFDASEVSADRPLTGAIRDAGGPLEVQGRIKFTPPRNYEISGTVAARPGAPPELENALQMAGPRTSDGHHEFSAAGTF